MTSSLLINILLALAAAAGTVGCGAIVVILAVNGWSMPPVRGIVLSAVVLIATAACYYGLFFR